MLLMRSSEDAIPRPILRAYATGEVDRSAARNILETQIERLRLLDIRGQNVYDELPTEMCSATAVRNYPVNAELTRRSVRIIC